MKLSTRGRYATRALLDVALHGEEEPVLLKHIAQRQQISQRYLEHLIKPLTVGGILRSTRGAKGGISLARPPEQIKISEVMQLVEGSLALVECVTNPEICERSSACVTRNVWCELKDAINSVLESKTLGDLVEQEKAAVKSREAMYYI